MLTCVNVVTERVDFNLTTERVDASLTERIDVDLTHLRDFLVKLSSLTTLSYAAPAATTARPLPSRIFAQSHACQVGLRLPGDVCQKRPFIKE